MVIDGPRGSLHGESRLDTLHCLGTVLFYLSLDHLVNVVEQCGALVLIKMSMNQVLEFGESSLVNHVEARFAVFVPIGEALLYERNLGRVGDVERKLPGETAEIRSAT